MQLLSKLKSLKKPTAKVLGVLMASALTLSGFLGGVAVANAAPIQPTPNTNTVMIGSIGSGGAVGMSTAMTSTSPITALS